MHGDWTRTANPARDATELTSTILTALDARSGMAVADIGAGAGYFTFKLSELVGPSGRVVATDTDPQRRRLLEAQATERGAANVRVATADPQDPVRIGLEPNSVDRLLAVNVFLFTTDGYLARALGDERSAAFMRLAGLWRALRPGGRAVIVNDKVRTGSDLALVAIETIAAELFDIVQRRELAEPAPEAEPGYLLVLRKRGSAGD